MSDERVTLTAVLQANRWVLLTASFLLPLAACAVLSGFRGSLASATDVLVLVLVVVAAAATGDRLAGFIAAVSAGVWFDFFLTVPYNTFSIKSGNDVETTVLLLLIGGAVVELALWGRRQQARASRRAGYLDGALNTAQIVSARHESAQSVIELVAGQIVDVLGIVSCRYESGPVNDTMMAVMDHDGVVTRSGHPVHVERDGLPTDTETALPVVRDGCTVGHFVLSSASDIARPSQERRRVAVLLAGQVASVLGDRAS